MSGLIRHWGEGTYKTHGLEVTIRMGGPQLNGLQLLAAGRLDVAMGVALQVVSAVEQGVPLTGNAATFLKHPTPIIAHPGVRRFEGLKGKPIAIAAANNTTFWPWLKRRYGFTDDQKRPMRSAYSHFSSSPRRRNKVSRHPSPSRSRKAGSSPVVFLVTDLGYPPCSEARVVTRETLARRGDTLARFVRASAKGWKSHLAKPGAGNALIKRDNPQMGDELLAFSHRKMKEYAIVSGGDAASNGLLTMPTPGGWGRSISCALAISSSPPPTTPRPTRCRSCAK